MSHDFKHIKDTEKDILGLTATDFSAQANLFVYKYFWGFNVNFCNGL